MEIKNLKINEKEVIKNIKKMEINNNEKKKNIKRYIDKFEEEYLNEYGNTISNR